MSVENRKRMYDKLVASNKLYQDDGALVKEFGKPADVDINYSAFTVAQLKSAAKKKGLDFLEKDTKDKLIVLLETGQHPDEAEQEVK